MIVRGMDQQKICSAIKLCKNSSSMKEKEEAVKIISRSVVTNTVECELCDYLATIAEEYVKNIPDWMIDIKNFKDILIPFDCQTVYIYNPLQNAVVDLKTEELFLIPEE